MIDVLPLLPPDTRITGYVGDGGSYIKFETTAGTARADIAEVCARHAKLHSGYHASMPNYVGAPTHPSSYWFYERQAGTTATLAEFPGVTLTLDTPDGLVTDIRTDPWIVTAVHVEGPDFTTYSEPHDSAARAAEFYRKLADMLDKLAGAK